MSRCYPFPPPGYVPKTIRDDSLFKSIKEANEKAKREKKDKKLKKEKKRKERENEEADQSKKRRHKRKKDNDHSELVKSKERENEEADKSKKRRHKRKKDKDHSELVKSKERENEEADKIKKHRHKRKKDNDHSELVKRKEETDKRQVKDVGANELSKKVNDHSELVKRKEKENETNLRQVKDVGDNGLSKKVNDHSEVKKSECKFLEKSCLTIELEHRSSSQNSSESTLHSNEKPEQSQNLDGRHNDSEIGIRSWLHDKEQKDHDVMMTNKNQNQCSSQERLKDASQAAPSKSVDHPCLTSANELPPNSLRVCQEKKDYEVMMTKKDQNQYSSQAAPSKLVDHPCSTSANELPPNSLRVCQEKKDHEVRMTNKNQNQSSSQERLKAASQAVPSKSVDHPCSTSANELPPNALRVCQDKRRDPLSTKKPIPLNDIKSRKRNREISTKPYKENLSSGLQDTTETSKLCRKCPPSIAEQFLNLIENWTPDRVESKLTDSEDQEWLVVKEFSAKRQCQVSNQTTSNETNSLMWPTAKYLPEVEIYALPYTVPF